MSIDLTGITNKNEYYTNHYFATVFEENASSTISGWNAASKESEEVHTPWSLLRQNARQYYAAHDRFVRSSVNLQTLSNIRTLADSYLASLGYPVAKPEVITVDDTLAVPVYLEMTKTNGAPLLWVILSASAEADAGILESSAFNSDDLEDDASGALYKGILNEMPNEDLATKILFGSAEPPRFLIFIGMNQIALIDRNKWNEKRYLQFDLEEIFSRLENTTLQAMAVLLHKDSLCPDDGKILLDELDEQSQKNASGVSQDLKYALRESIELLGNEVLYDMAHRLGRDLEAEPVDAGQLTLECLRYMYRMLFVLFIESRPELGYTPIKEQVYHSGYSLESLRDIADNIRDDTAEVGSGYYLHETLAKLYKLIYWGYPKTEAELYKATGSDSLHDMFLIAPLKAHIFDPEYTSMITTSKLRNSCMLRIIDLMSLTKSTGKKNSRRGRISYANLGINQMGAVYEALLSYRGFIAEHDLYEVKRAGDTFNELDVGYFVSESELDQYTEDERVYKINDEGKKKLRMYEKGTFIYRLAGREREKSASYYTPEVLTKCLVKYALKELLEGKTADDILELTVCEPAMGSAAFLNETINQLAEAYISLKEKETGDIIRYEKRFNELQKVKMYIADRNVYGIDLNPIAVELAEVSLWLNTIFQGGFVPWFGTQLVNGNSLIGARRQCYRVADVQATSKGLRWYENEPERAPLDAKKMLPKRIFHFLLGDPGMCSYTDKVIKSLEPDNIKLMTNWNKKFVEPYSDGDVETLLELSKTINALWKAQIKNRKMLEENTRSSLSVFGHSDSGRDSMTSIREKDKILRAIYKSEHAQNAGPYARLKFAMDYWCSLWFWPISEAEKLPTRAEFLNDMNLILVGVMQTQQPNNYRQARLFTDEPEDEDYIWENTEVNIDQLCQLFPRLALVRQIAGQNKFMHWELEFAELFAERGGFDLVIGNPPWVLLGWNEQNVLSDTHPIFAIKNLSATETARQRNEAFSNCATNEMYFTEYTNISGEQNFLNSTQNYPLLIGMKANLYKCFLPQAWTYNSPSGISAFVHPDGVFDDPKGSILRKTLYRKVCNHFSFINQMKLFDIGNTRTYSLNVYSNIEHDGFDLIANLFVPSTIDFCYESNEECKYLVPGIKDGNNWDFSGHPNRIIHIGEPELRIIAKILGSNDYEGVSLPLIHSKEILEIVACFATYEQSVASYKNNLFITQMWNETNAQNDNIILRNTHFADSLQDVIYSGAHIGVGNPVYKTSQRVCATHRAFDYITIDDISDNYIQRTNYSVKCSLSDYCKQIPVTPWGTRYNADYRLASRKMIDSAGERTLISAIIPPETGHTDGILGIAFKDNELLVINAGAFASIPYDFFIKMLGKSNLYEDTAGMLPLLLKNRLTKLILVRSLLLNAISEYYGNLLGIVQENLCLEWSKEDSRLRSRTISPQTRWSHDLILRKEYERHQALIEIDVLTAMALGMTLIQLKTIYKIQFPVLQQYEDDTWYDTNGRIVFTTNRSLSSVGYDRKTWENEVKGAPAGKKFYRTITDDTMPGGPVERTIEYVAPFDRCDREKDYETAWKFFEEKYKGGNTQGICLRH